MINRIVYSYCTNNGTNYAHNFNTEGDLFKLWERSLEACRVYTNTEIVIYTDLLGKIKILEKLDSDLYDEIIIVDYTQYNWLDTMWNYPKLITYSLQDKPFIHLDQDFILTEELPQKDLESDVLCEGINPNNKSSDMAIQLGVEIDPNIWYVISSGLLGGNNIQIFKDLFTRVNEEVNFQEWMTGEYLSVIEEVMFTDMLNKKGIKYTGISTSFLHIQGFCKNVNI